MLRWLFMVFLVFIIFCFFWPSQVKSIYGNEAGLPQAKSARYKGNGGLSSCNCRCVFCRFVSFRLMLEQIDPI